MEYIIANYKEMEVNYLKKLKDVGLVNKLLSSKGSKCSIEDLIQLEKYFNKQIHPALQGYLKTLDINNVLRFVSAADRYDLKHEIIKYKLEEIYRSRCGSVNLNFDLFMEVYIQSNIELDYSSMRNITSKIRMDIDKLLLTGIKHSNITFIFEALRRCWTVKTVDIENMLQCVSFLKMSDCTGFFDVISEDFWKHAEKTNKLNLVLKFHNFIGKNDKERSILGLVLNKLVTLLLKDDFYEVDELVKIFEICLACNRKTELEEFISRITVDGFANGHHYNKQTVYSETPILFSKNHERTLITLVGKAHYHHIIIPLLFQISQTPENIKDPLMQKLVKMCLNYCDDLTNGKEKIPVPVTFNLGATTDCTCYDCQQVLEFVNSPTLLSKTFQQNYQVIKSKFAPVKCLSYQSGQGRLTIEKSLYSPHINEYTLEECKVNKTKLAELLVKDGEEISKKRDNCDTLTDYETEPSTKKVKM